MKRTIRKALPILLSAAMLFSMGASPVFAEELQQPSTDTGVYSIDWYGDGSASDFTLNSANDLAGLSVLTNGLNGNTPVSFEGKTVTLASPVDLSAEQWTPIGTDANPFKGSFDGGNNAITGMTITGALNSGETHDYIGLFGSVDGPGSSRIIENVTLEVTIDLSNDGETQLEVGGLAGSLSSVNVENCTVAGSINVSNANNSSGCMVGGFSGTTSAGSIVTGCSSSVPVVAEGAVTATGDHDTAGFVGNPTQTVFTDCIATGDVTATTYGLMDFNEAGGFFGYSSMEISAKRCSANGNVKVLANDSATSAVAGGFFGKYDGLDGNAPMEKLGFSQCVSTGNVTVESNETALALAGGFAGLSIAPIRDSYAVGDVSATGATGSARAGGFAGQATNYSKDYADNRSSSITNCFALGSVSAQDGETHKIAGGFVGNHTGAATTAGKNTITNCYALGADVNGEDGQSGAFGGILGNPDAVLSGNKALSEMEVNGVVDTASAADGLSGEKFTLDALASGTAFTDFDTTIWEFNQFGIPVLLNVSGQPENYSEHLKISYTVTFDVNGGTGNNSSAQVYKGSLATAPTAKPEKVGSHFNGWYLDGTKFDFENTPISKNITLKANYAVHTPTKNNDCTTAIICSACYAEITAAKAHVLSGWQFDETDHWKACGNTGCIHTEQTAAHIWNAGEITTPSTHTQEGVKTYTCTVCGQTKTEGIPNLPSNSVIVDNSTGTKAEYEDGSTFDLGTELSVISKPQAEMDKFKDNIDKAAPGLVLGGLYDISLLKGGVAIQPDGKVKVSIPLTDKMKSMTNLQVVYIDDKGKITILPNEVKDGKIVFVTDHFSYYGVIGKVNASDPGNSNSSEKNNGNTNSPQTGDSSPVLLFVLMLLTSGIALVILAQKRKIFKHFIK